MPENWADIAAEVDAALRSVADVSQADGYPATLRLPAVGAHALGEAPSGSPTYATVFVVEGVREIKDTAGTAVVQTMRTLLISAAGSAPTKGQAIAVGVKAESITSQTIWNEIAEVRPVSPAGIAVLYEVDLVA